MTLVPNWRAVLKHAWSIRLIILAGLLAALEGALSLMGGLALPFWAHAAVAILAPVVSLAALLARIVAQGELSDG